MSYVELSRVINSAVVPVVIISACGLICLALYNRLAAIVSRLRAFQRERLTESLRLQQREGESELPQRRQLLAHLAVQTRHVTRRARLIRKALAFLLATIGLLIVCCMLLEGSIIFPRLIYVAVPTFTLGLCSMLAGIISAGMELRDALEPADLEDRFVADVLQDETVLADEV